MFPANPSTIRLGPGAVTLRHVETRYGPMLAPDPDKDVIGRFLSKYGEWADLEIRFVAQNIDEDAKIADVGACLGTFGIGLSHRKNLGGIAFVEPNREVIPALKKNVKNCRAKNVVCQSMVVPHGWQGAEGTRDEHNIGSASYVKSDRQTSSVRVPMPSECLTLEDLDSRFGPFGLIKLDIEGMELDVLGSSPALLRRSGTTVWAECNETVTSLDLAQLLLNCGFQLYYFAFPSFNRDNFFKSPDSIYGFAYEAGLLARHGPAVFDPALRALGCVLYSIPDVETLRRALWQTPRWTPPQISSEYLEATLAMAVRALNAESYTDFLSGPAGRGEAVAEWSPVLELRTSLHRTQEGLARAEKVVAERDSQIEQLNQGFRRAEEIRAEQVDKLRDRVIRAEELVAERDRYILGMEARSKQAVLDHDRRAVQLRSKLARAETLAATQGRLLREKDVECRSALMQAQLQSAEIEALRDLQGWHEAVSRDRLALLRTERGMRLDQLSELNRTETRLQATETQLNAAQTQLKATETQLNAAEEQLKVAEAQLEAAEAQLHALGAQLHAVEKQLNAVYTSTSWRLTSFLRKLLGKTPQLHGFFRALVRFARRRPT